MKTLVLGPGGREHALVNALLADPQVTQVHVAPGNAGIAAQVPVHPVDANDPQDVLRLARQLSPELIVIGPEAPLAAGVSDVLREHGFTVFGPSQQAARLESSKSFAKQIMQAAGVPTAGSQTASTSEQARVALQEFGAPYVVKDDGLAAGKGVVVTEDFDIALAHSEACFAAGSQVVIEQFLDGPEVSVFVIADGTEAVALAPAQDFKRIFDGDTGPNTGGMGAYTPLDWLPGGAEAFTEQVLEQVARPVLAEMAARGTPFTGVLYCGLAVTSAGIQVIEFNTRFGDPETQPVLARLTSPLGGLLKAAAQGELARHPELAPTFSDDYAVAVVLASPGYPGPTHTGEVISGLDPATGQLLPVTSEPDAATVQAPEVLHAGTALNDDGDFISAGGRLLAVVGRGESLAAARDHAYAGIRSLELPGGQYRTDIARAATLGDIVVHPGAPAHRPGPVPEIPGWRPVYSGKVRDLYEPADTEPGTSDRLLVVATDTISAFDHLLQPGIPDKGTILTHMSRWWFDQLAAPSLGADEDEEYRPIPHHMLPEEVPAQVAGRGMVVRRLQMLPVECIARGYLTGSGWAEYQEYGTLAGVPLPDGLVDGSRLPEPMFTPSAKAEVGEHDENITFEQMADRVGYLRAERLKELTLQIYRTAERIARGAGIILADTKVEFGIDMTTGLITLGDEVLTPDSSRFWDAETYQPGSAQASFDKQYVRDWLVSPASGWDKNSGAEPPELPEEVVSKTRQRYLEAFRRLTGRAFSVEATSEQSG